MHILICDDDAAFGARIAEYVTVYFTARSVQVHTAVCTSAAEVLATPGLELYQLAFLDVDMPGANGMVLGRQLKQKCPGLMLVYVSAYLEFALEGYTVNAYRYLLKRDIARTLPKCLDDLLAALTDQRKTLTVHHNRTETEIPLDQIYYLESDLRQINVYGDIARQPICTYYGKIADLPPMLYENGFLQVSRSDVVKSSVVGVIPAGLFMLLTGALMSIVTGQYDISAILASLGVPFVGLVALVLATWTTNVTNAYSGGLALSNLLGFDESKFKITTGVAGGIGTLLAAFGLLNAFQGFLSLMSALIPPLAGVLIASYWIVGKGKRENFSPRPGFSAVGVISFAIGAVFACITGGTFASFPGLVEALPFLNWPFFVGPVNGIVVSLVLYVGLAKLTSAKRMPAKQAA